MVKNKNLKKCSIIFAHVIIKKSTMPSQLLYGLERFKESLIVSDNFQNDILIAEFDQSLLKLEDGTNLSPHPSRYDALILAGVMEGEIEFSVDYVTFKIPKNAVMWIMPSHISQVISITPNLKGWLLVASRDFLESNGESSRNNVSTIYLQLKKNPFTVFEPEEFQALYQSLQVIQTRMRQHTHLFSKEIISTALKLFFLDMGNFFLGKKENVYTPTLTRKEELFAGFLTLLSQHCMKQHEVSFYAGELCITPQYLSLVLKEQSGRSASQWIQGALMSEAKILLKSPRINVQEVADQLNFPDQSTFGKFFKKHAGISPMAFRKS